MANIPRSEPKRMYSWWWDSHISPKNSKWLQENLKDMDSKVKAMIKLLEEDADSFARKAEMYYKKRPELMKLVEEFYRAYRALAERYDHATGALRQAQRTMSEAFPNQIPLGFLDESPHGSSGNEVEPHTPEMPPPFRALIDPDDSQKDTLGLSSEIHVIRKVGQFSDESDSSSSKKGLKQLNDMFGSGNGAIRVTLPEGRVRKGLNFQEDGENSVSKVERGSGELQRQVKGEEDSGDIIKILRQDISNLTMENQNLKNQIAEASGHTIEVQNEELQRLNGTLSKLKDEKDAHILEYQEKISSLENQLLNSQSELKKLNDEMVMKIKELNDAEDLNQSLHADFDTIEKRAKMQEHELNEKQRELEKLLVSLEDKNQQCVHIDMDLLSKEKLLVELQEEIKISSSEMQKQIEKTKELEVENKGLHDEICNANEKNKHFNEQNIRLKQVIHELCEEIKLLEEKKRKLEEEVGVHVGAKEMLRQEISGVKEDLEQKHQDLKVLEAENFKLQEICKKLETDKETLEQRQISLEEVMRKNMVLENSLSDANVELNDVRRRNDLLEKFQESLNTEISTYIHEKESLVSQVEILTRNLEKFTEENNSLKNTLSSMDSEVKHLSSRLKEFEDTCQSLEYSKSALLAENESIISKVGSVSFELESREALIGELKEMNIKLSTEKVTLHDQVEGIMREIESKEISFSELKEEIMKLSSQKNLLNNQVIELQDRIKLEKQEHEILIQSFESQLTNSRDQILLLQERDSFNQKNLELEQNSVSSASMEILILQSTLYDICEKNSILSVEAQKHLEACNMHKRNILTLSNHTEKLRKGIHILNNALTTEKEPCVDEVQDEVLINIALNEITGLQAEAEFNCLQKNIEISVLLTLVKQIGLDMVKLRSDYSSLETTLDIKTEKLLTFENNLCALTKMNEQLMKDIEASIQRERLLKQQMNLETSVLATIVKQMGLDAAYLTSENWRLQKSLESKTEELLALEKKQHELIGINDQLMKEVGESNQREEILEQQMNIEISVLLTLLNQFGLNCLTMESGKHFLEHQLDVKNEELLVLENEKHELMGLNNELRKDLLATVHSEETLKQQMSLQISVLLTLMKQLELEMANVKTEKIYLENELGARTQDLLDLKDKEREQLVMNEQLIKDVKTSNQREEQLKQQMSIEISVLLTFVKQLELDMANMKSENCYLETELGIRIQDLLDLKDNKCELLAMSEQLTKDLEASNQREELLKQQTVLEISALATLVKQLEQNVDNLTSEKYCLEEELNIRNDNLVSLESQKHELQDLSENLKKDLEASKQREELLDQHLNIETSVLLALVKQLGLDVTNLRAEKYSLQRELQIKTEDLLVLRNNMQELVGLNEQLMKDVEKSNKREELTKQEMGMEISVLATLLKQLELEVANLKSVKHCLENELNMKTEDLLSLQSKKHQLQVLSEDLKEDLQASKQREELLDQQLNVEISILLALIKQLGLDVAIVRAEKYSLQKMLHTKTEDLLALKNNMTELKDQNEKLMNDVEAGIQREELLEQRTNLELSLLATLLKQTAVDAINLSLEKNHFEEQLEINCEKLLALENEKHELIGFNVQLMKDVDASSDREQLLRTELEVLSRHLQELQLCLQASNYEISNLTEENKTIAEEISGIKQKNKDLEVENNEVIAEAMKLDHLYEFFKCFSNERLSELNSLSSCLDSLQLTKSVLHSRVNKLNREISDLQSEKQDLMHNITHMEEEFNKHLLILKLELSIALGLYKEVNDQADDFKLQLISKEKELSEMSHKLESSDAKNKELCLLLEGLQLEHEEDKLLKEELKKKITSLSDALSQSMEEIKSIHEVYQVLQTENSQIHEEVDQLTNKEKNLIVELQKELDEVQQCEEDFAALLTKSQITTVYASLFQDKIHELLLEREIGSKVLNELHKRLEGLEAANRGLAADKDVYFSLLQSLQKAIIALEEEIKSTPKRKPRNNNSEKEFEACEVCEDHLCMDTAGALLKRLISKVEALQKVIANTKSEPEHQRVCFTGGCDVANKEIEGSQRVVAFEEVQESANSIHHVDSVTDNSVGNDVNKKKHGLNMKDIELDQASSSYKKIEQYNVRTSNAEIDDQLWEAAERDCNNQSTNRPSIDFGHGIEVVEEGSTKYPYSKPVDEKEVSIDKLEVPKRALSQREWSQKVLKELSSDAQKLSDLKESIEELKTKMGSSYMEKFPANFGFDTLKVQFKAAEGEISELIDTNKKLINTVEGYSSSNGVVVRPEESVESGISGRKQISEQARRESDKVGKLELDLQKIQYVLLKLEEEHENRRLKTAHRKARIVLRDYLYGRRDNRKSAKKSHLCGCMSPKTKGEN